MKNGSTIFLFAALLLTYFLCAHSFGAVQYDPFQKKAHLSSEIKGEITSKISKIRIPFIANKGQVDERVRYYARTFGGTVFPVLGKANVRR